MKVFCRFAPNGTANDKKKLSIEVEDRDDCLELTLIDREVGSSFNLGCHGVFGPTDQQRHVYNSVGLPLIEKVLEGESCALLAYGQTASGKTHSMLGPSGGDPQYLTSDHRGIVPRLIEDLFSAGSSIEESPGEFKLHISFFEIYNETVTDLVAKSHAMHAAKATGADGQVDPMSFVFKPTERHRLQTSLKRITCHNASQALELISALSMLRWIASTQHNLRSSRSHVVLQLTPSLTAKETQRSLSAGAKPRKGIKGPGSGGKLCLIDLAGSESLKAPIATWASGTSSVAERFDIANVCAKDGSQAKERQLETKSINVSLFALKKVVHALHERAEHIPYKDSVLTVILQDCLPSPGCTTLLVCCSTTHKDVHETLATLRFAAEAAKIRSGFGGFVVKSVLSRPSGMGKGATSASFSDHDVSQEWSADSISEGRMIDPQPRPTTPPPQKASDTALNSHVLELLSENAQLRTNVDRLEKEVHRLHGEKKETEDSVSRLLEHCNRLATSYSAMEEELRVLRLENESLKAAKRRAANGDHFSTATASPQPLRRTYSGTDSPAPASVTMVDSDSSPSGYNPMQRSSGAGAEALKARSSNTTSNRNPKSANADSWRTIETIRI